MEAIKLKTIIKKDGEINISGVPCKKGEKIEMIILLESNFKSKSQDILSILPKHKLGTGIVNLNRDIIYDNER